jgi:DNA-binding MarR family transcriptional regulator
MPVENTSEKKLTSDKLAYTSLSLHHSMMKPRTATPIGIAQECIIARLRILTRVITKMYDDALRPLGIKISQLNILVVAGTAESIVPAEVCRRLQLDLSTLSRNVDRMRARGWIELIADEADGRAHLLKLTRKGRQLLENAKPAWEKTQKEVHKLLGGSCVEALHAAADKVRS